MPVMTAMPAARPDGRAVFDTLMVEKRIVIHEPYPKHYRGGVEASDLSRPNACAANGSWRRNRLLRCSNAHVLPNDVALAATSLQRAQIKNNPVRPLFPGVTISYKFVARYETR
jgi:hypothetical protein